MRFGDCIIWCFLRECEMAEIVKGEGGRQTHVESPLMRESLMDKGVLAATGNGDDLRILPDVNIIAIAGSILDRGRVALIPLLEEVVRCRRDHKIVLGVGGGARTRHAYHIASDLGLPIGGLAMVAGAVNEQNRYMVQALLCGTAAWCCTRTISSSCRFGWNQG